MRERLLETATRLFESQGYQSTGINQIIADSGTAKASFYEYFPSKAALGVAYLDAYGTHHLALIENLLQRAGSPNRFFLAWVRLLRRQLRAGQLYGCPMANMRAQVGEASPELVAKVVELTQQTLSLLQNHFVAAGILASKKEAATAARRVFAAYEGAMQMWRLTGDDAALEDIPVLALAALTPSGDHQVERDHV